MKKKRKSAKDYHYEFLIKEARRKGVMFGVGMGLITATMVFVVAALLLAPL